MKLYINDIKTAVPPLSVTQEEAFIHMDSFFELTETERKWYGDLFHKSPVKKRHLGLEKVEEIANTDQDELVCRFEREARKIGVEAAQKCLASLDFSAADIRRLTVNTCTGYLCPGLTSYLVEDLGLKSSVNVCDIMGMGCGGAIPNLQASADFVQTHKGAPALSVQVEICSATFYRGEDPGQMVSNAIFGDGASALLLSGQEGLFEVIDFESLILPGKREKLMFKTENSKLKNILTRDVPVIGARACRDVISRLLANNKLSKEDVAHWAVHPGGKTVLNRIKKNLKLSKNDLKHSYYIFENFGNMSSTSVVFVLKKISESAGFKSGDYVIMTSFGAGFTAFACLLRAV